MRNLTAALAARRARRSGFSLVEIAMVLAIVALLVAGVMLFFSNATNAQKTNDAMTELAALQQIVRSVYSGQADYTGLTTAIVANSNQLPAKWVKGALLSGPFSGPVTVVSSGTFLSFIVTFNNIPDASCTKMSTTDFGTGLLSVTVNGAAAVAARALTPTEANAACKGTANQNVIIWNFV